MKNIGIDFDNTIITYDGVFYKYAVKLGLISCKVKKNKQMIRDAIRALPEGNDRWTELQGMVYGEYIDEARPTRGIEGFLRACKKNSCKVSIISHKTLYPAMGPRVNLQEAAKRWIKRQDFLSRFALSESDIIFEETLEGKLDAISDRQCEYFIDDLPEVLSHPDFPKGVKKMLYGRQEHEISSEDVMHFKDWNEIKKHFFE